MPHHRHTDPRILDAPARVDPIVVVGQPGPNRADRRRNRGKRPTPPASNTPFRGSVAAKVPELLGAREESRRSAAHRLAAIMRRDNTADPTRQD